MDAATPELGPVGSEIQNPVLSAVSNSIVVEETYLDGRV